MLNSFVEELNKHNSILKFCLLDKIPEIDNVKIKLNNKLDASLRND